MKIAFVSQPFDTTPPVGGASIAIWIDELATRLAKDHEIAIYSRQTLRSRPDEVAQRICHVRVPVGLDEKTGISSGALSVSLIEWA